FFFSSRRRHTRFSRDWSSDVCSSDLRVAYDYPTIIRQLTGMYTLKDIKMKVDLPPIYTGELNGTSLGNLRLAASDFGLVAVEWRSEERRVGKEASSRRSS